MNFIMNFHLYPIQCSTCHQHHDIDQVNKDLFTKFCYDQDLQSLKDKIQVHLIQSIPSKLQQYFFYINSLRMGIDTFPHRYEEQIENFNNLQSKCFDLFHQITELENITLPLSCWNFHYETMIIELQWKFHQYQKEFQNVCSAMKYSILFCRQVNFHHQPKRFAVKLKKISKTKQKSFQEICCACSTSITDSLDYVVTNCHHSFCISCLTSHFKKTSLHVAYSCLQCNNTFKYVSIYSQDVKTFVQDTENGWKMWCFSK